MNRILKFLPASKVSSPASDINTQDKLREYILNRARRILKENREKRKQRTSTPHPF